MLKLTISSAGPSWIGLGMEGEDLTVYWLEHVLRHNGTPHLKLSSKNLPFYQSYLLDIWLFLAVVFIENYLFL